MAYFTYILHGTLKKSRTNTFYIGYTHDIKERLELHKEGKGALRTSMMKNLEVVYLEPLTTQKKAMRRERELKNEFKKLKRREKWEFINESVFKVNDSAIFST